MAKREKNIIETQPQNSIEYSFSDKDKVIIIGLKGSKHLTEGKEYIVSGHDAKIILNKKEAILK